MKNKLFALACYMMTIILILFYIVVLIKSRNMNVSTEYRMFYIDDSLAYYLEDGGLKNYRTNQEFAYVTNGTYRNQGKGWGAITDDGTWTCGPESFIYYYIQNMPADSDEYYLMIRMFESFEKCAEVIINQKKVGSKQIGRDGILCIEIPVEMIKEGVNEIILRTEAAESEPYFCVKTVELKQTEGDERRKEKNE